MSVTGALVRPRAPARARDRVAAHGKLLAWAVATRVLVVACAYVLHRRHRPQGFFPVRYDAFDSANHVLGSWDGEWYRRVALHGYHFVPGRQSDTAFFPLYPLTMRAVHLLGPDLLLSGLIVSNVLFVVAVLAFAALTRELFGEETGRRAAIWLCVFPLGFVFSMEYPTSLVFALMALGALAAVRGRWLWAALALGLAGLARPEAAVLVLPLGVLAWRRGELARPRVLAALLAAPVAIASFPVYLWFRIGNFHAWTEAQRQWDRSFHALGLWDAFATLPTQLDLHHWLWRDVGFLVAYVVLLLLAWRAGVDWPWIVAAAALVVVPLASGTVESVARFGMVGFAFYWVVARTVPGGWVERTLQAGCLALVVWWMLLLPLANP
jgi:hypothetical protein